MSRNEPDISEYLWAGSAHCTGVRVFNHEITPSDTRADVLSFSEFMVNRKLARKPVDLRQRIATQAANRSEGMFLMIKLLEQDIYPGKNEKQLNRTIKNMPSGIGQAYSRELNKISLLKPFEKEQAVALLKWVLFAVRPLKVKELAEALAVSSDDLEEGYPSDDLPDSWHDGFVDEDYVREMIIGPCGSLLQLRSTGPGLPLADHTVHFVHFSVKEFLTTPDVNSDWAVRLGIQNSTAEELRLSNICLRYLTLDNFQTVPPATSIYPFLSYASWAWYFHSFHQSPIPPTPIVRRTQKAFDPSICSWKVW